MSIGKILYSLFGNGHRENIIFTVNSGESVTLNFKDSGTDSATEKYYALTSQAKKVAITTNKVASITHIDGVELKYPRTLGTATMNTFSSGIEWSKITVRADLDSTTFEVYAS